MVQPLWKTESAYKGKLYPYVYTWEERKHVSTEDLDKSVDSRFIEAKSWKQCSSTKVWINKLWNSLTMECYSAIEHELWIQVTPQLTVEAPRGVKEAQQQRVPTGRFHSQQVHNRTNPRWREQNGGPVGEGIDWKGAGGKSLKRRRSSTSLKIVLNWGKQ